MIEGVNSVLANAAIVRANAEQSSVVRSFAANPARVQEAASAPQAPYISPYIHLDVNYNKAVLQIRDSDTGDVLKQFPSNTTLEARRRAATAQQNAQLANEGTNTGEVPAPQTQSTPEFQVQEVSVERSSPGTTGVTVNAEAQVAAAAFASAAIASSAGASTVSITA